MNMMDWKWLNESKIICEGNEIVIHAPGYTDWFNNPVPENGALSAPVANAPFFYTEVEGDFVFRAKVRPNFRTVYDACALMVIQDEKLWAKAAFEKSDFGTTAAVCVVTNGISDDANGYNIQQDEVWLQIVRVGDVFCTHYSLDGFRKLWAAGRRWHAGDHHRRTGPENRFPADRILRSERRIIISAGLQRLFASAINPARK